MRIVAANQLHQWLEQGQVLEKDSRGVKVLKLADDRLLKIFRPRRRLWLARLQPPAQCFAENAQRLLARQIAAPEVLECLWIDPPRAVSACLYVPLPGQSMDKLFLHAREQFDQLLPALAGFIHTLHQSGIYFRSLHLGNVLYLPDGHFGLIDFLDIQFKRRALGPMLIRRNLQHLKNYLNRKRIEDFPWDALLQAYEQAKKTHPVG